MTPDEKRAYQREWYANNKEKRKAAQRKYNGSDKGKAYHADFALRRKYGISLEEKQAMHDRQDGKCLICEDAATDLDHCHETGAVRGLLCGACNRGLGAFKDRPDLLQKAAAYLYERSPTSGAQAAA